MFRASKQDLIPFRKQYYNGPMQRKKAKRKENSSHRLHESLVTRIHMYLNQNLEKRTKTKKLLLS